MEKSRKAVVKIKDYYVYEWFNVDTGEVFYIGKGTNGRYKHKKGRNSYFNQYINKHKCQTRIKINDLTEDEAYKKEIELISYYKKLDQAQCNLTVGGENPPTYYGENNPFSRRIIQLSLDGEFINEWGCISDAAKVLNVSEAPISSCCKNKYGRKSYGGYLWLYKEDYCPKKDYKYKPINNSRYIVQFDINGKFIKEWNSAVEIERTLGFKRSGICGCCKGYYNTSNGYVWKYKDETAEKKQIKVRKGKSRVPVVQLDLNNNFINSYKDCAEASRSIGMKSNSHIVACCNNKENTAFGFKWMYEHEYKKQSEDFKASFLLEEVVFEWQE